MQTFRDTAAVLIVILLVLSVRVTGSEGDGVVESAFAGENQHAGLAMTGPVELPALAAPMAAPTTEPDPAGVCPHEGDGTAASGDCFDCGARATVNEALKHDCT